VTAVAGVWLITAGIIGYLARPLGLVRRTLLGGAGLLLLVPDNAFRWAAWTDAIGFALAALLVWMEFAGGKHT